MAKDKCTATTRSTRRAAANHAHEEPDIYQQMLVEAGVSTQHVAAPEKPLKRRRTESALSERSEARRPQDEQCHDNIPEEDNKAGEVEDDGGLEFEDVILPEPTVQTLERDSDDNISEEEENEEEEVAFEDVEFMRMLQDTRQKAQAQDSTELELNLTAQQPSLTLTKRGGRRHKALTREDKERRIEVHKVHLLCLLSHVARRNHWCNDPQVKADLLSHLTHKTVNYLNPSSRLSQFGQAESLKNGLKQAAETWSSKFVIRERGLRRALWAEDLDQLEHYAPLTDMDSCLDRASFREAAQKLEGSRDLGAQLYCALLRASGARVRLVCSLQPLSCVSGAPTLPRPKEKLGTASSSKSSKSRDIVENYEKMAGEVATVPPIRPTVRWRLGHPGAAAHNFKHPTSWAPGCPTFDTPVTIRESPHPVYWVEIFDVGHQKWQPADPIVLRSFWKPKLFEPPLTDKENCLCYVVAFEADGTAKDVTRRYAKAYMAKTSKLRVESVLVDGEKWWRQVMALFRRQRLSDSDEIEDNELAGAEAREPMPRNLQDFKHHPIYALERHLRKNEVLVPGATPSGTVGAGSRSRLEKIYRRKDVRIARTPDKWFRLGREVKPNEIPAKWLSKKCPPKHSRIGSDSETLADDPVLAGTPIYTIDQTNLYEPPLVRDGRLPKNKFGNVEVYVPSMIPRGAVHMKQEHVARAAYILGLDYAPALTGFQFKGRQGTAVLQGVLVAAQFEQAVQAVAEGLADLEQEAADEMKRLSTLKMWRRLVMGLRIRERVWAGVDEKEREEADRRAAVAMDVTVGDTNQDLDTTLVQDDEGGGFLVE